MLQPLNRKGNLILIAIVDYGMGNLASVKKALDFIGEDSLITDDAKMIRKASGVILPGVGAFAPAMENLRSKGLDEAIKEFASSASYQAW